MKQHPAILLCTFVLASILMAGLVSAQETTLLPEKAQSLFLAGNWKEAAAAYRSLLVRDSSNATSWYRLGYCYQSMQKYVQAAEAYERAVVIVRSPATFYNLACAYARLGEKQRALHDLEEAASAGFNQLNTIEKDDDLSSIRPEPGFGAILARVRSNAFPCEKDPVHRQFDFWIGEWNVYNPAGKLAGTSSVQNILGGCVVFENWTGSQGGAGKSFNFVDPASGKWRQTWVDSRGGKTEFTGALEGRDMIFSADEKDAQGNPFRRRLTFFNVGPGKVRQFSERTVDGGKTWTVDYDFTYVRQ